VSIEREPEDEDYDRLPDEAEADVARRDAEAADGPTRQRGRVLTFLRACVQELKRVDWPDRRHVFQATAVVLGFVVVAGAWLGLMDAVWQPVMEAIL
jgi:preprotein translocase subunit SecE